MDVKDLVLYQVATDRDYKVGDRLTFDQTTPNGQYFRTFETSFRVNGTRPSNIIYDALKKFNKKIKPTETLVSLANTFENYDIMLRELALEQVRQKSFPDKPSRLHCMYLSMTKEIALKNIDSMVKNNTRGAKIFQVVAVKLNGNLHKAAGRVTRESESFNHYAEKAVEYWSQTDLKDEDVMEVLFEGEAEIVEIIKEYRA